MNLIIKSDKTRYGDRFWHLYMNNLPYDNATSHGSMHKIKKKFDHLVQVFSGNLSAPLRSYRFTKQNG